MLQLMAVVPRWFLKIIRLSKFYRGGLSLVSLQLLYLIPQSLDNLLG